MKPVILKIRAPLYDNRLHNPCLPSLNRHFRVTKLSDKLCQLRTINRAINDL